MIVKKTRTIIACNYKDSLYNGHKNVIVQKIYLIVRICGLKLLSNPKRGLNKILQAKLRILACFKFYGNFIHSSPYICTQ